MSFRYSIRFSGAGGHGLIQAARILAEAVAVYDKMNAAESCSYGPEARGNASRAEIIISDEAIDYPQIDSVDLLIALTQEAYEKYLKDVGPSGTVIIDERVRAQIRNKTQKVFAVPFVEIAEKSCGRSAMVNIVALGVLANVSDVVNKKSIRQAILARVPKMSEDVYIKAYEAGLAAKVSHLIES